MITLVRRSGGDRLLVIVSLSNTPYHAGYVIMSDPSRLPDGRSLEVGNSGATRYGGGVGTGTGSANEAPSSAPGRFATLRHAGDAARSR